jgi:AraC-like DNA-binding protein
MGIRNNNQLPRGFSQHNLLPIRVVTPDFGHLSECDAEEYRLQQRLPYYFFLFVLEGSGRQRIDMEDYEIGKNELLFSLPYQTQQYSDAAHAVNYYKLGFDESCLSKLPKQYDFLSNPLALQKICFEHLAATRLKDIFKILLDLLRAGDSDQELILAYLNILLTEINITYFTYGKKPVGDKLGKFIGFKVFVESNLAEHPSIKKIAEELAVSTDTLYHIVKQYSGSSPKEFITNRLILEARRRLHYGQHTTVKELAFELGFNDPDYFSRMFKKITGKTVANFFKDLS